MHAGPQPERKCIGSRTRGIACWAPFRPCQIQVRGFVLCWNPLLVGFQRKPNGTPTFFFFWGGVNRKKTDPRVVESRSRLRTDFPTTCKSLMAGRRCGARSRGAIPACKRAFGSLRNLNFRVNVCQVKLCADYMGFNFVFNLLHPNSDVCVVQATVTRGFLGRLRGMLQEGIINQEQPESEKSGRAMPCPRRGGRSPQRLPFAFWSPCHMSNYNGVPSKTDTARWQTQQSCRRSSSTPCACSGDGGIQRSRPTLMPKRARRPVSNLPGRGSVCHRLFWLLALRCSLSL